MGKKRIAILQSNYIPWKGYFDIIGLVDEFVIYDEVQYTKNDWRNRNRIKTSAGIQWVTIPVYQRALKQKISETEVAHTRWSMKNWHTIKSNYARAPYFKFFGPELEEFYCTCKSSMLSEINVSLIRKMCSLIGIGTKISNSAHYTLRGDATEKLVDLCKQKNANTYLSGPAARDYLRQDLFKQAGIEIEWMDYEHYPEYPQLYPPFVHQVSIIDLLFNTGKDCINYMKCGRTPP